MGCYYYTLYHNTYAFSLLFYKFYMKRENAGSWNSGLEKEQILETYSAQLQKSLNSTEVNFGKYKKYLAKKVLEGAHTLATRVGVRPTPWARLPASWAPWQPSVDHLLLYEVFYPKKNQKQAFGTKLRRHEAEPWRNQSRAPAELFCRGHFPPGGGNHHHRHHHRSSHWLGVNLHQHLHQHHLLSNPSPSLVSNLCPKTSDWYLWVASSVDYSL